MYDVLVIGGGLAGLASAAHLARAGRRVLLAEKRRYPFHRVCGEYVSEEVRGDLLALGVDVTALGARDIRVFELCTFSGRSFRTQLPVGGFGLSRFRLDSELAQQARRAGAELREQTEVGAVEFEAERFRVRVGDATVHARVVLGCHGKRAKLDRQLGRRTFHRRSDYIAVKRHYRGPVPSGWVGLHTFPSGYCGASGVEDDLVNVCYLTTAKALRRAGSITALEDQLVYRNPQLAALARRWSPVTDKPLTISQIDFGSRQLIEQHVLMLGDASGVVHPLCGNGMAMALRAAAFGTRAIEDYLTGRTDRAALEHEFTRTWRHLFAQRLRFGRAMQPLLEHSALAELVCSSAQLFPTLARNAIRLSHGSSS